VLLGFTVSPLHALYVVILYLAVNLADGYGLTTVVAEAGGLVAPALILTSQVILGALWGVLGLMLATPLTACLLVLIRELYVKHRLESTRSASET
jgi:predicted PurR-regulated permease PerM